MSNILKCKGIYSKVLKSLFFTQRTTYIFQINPAKTLRHGVDRKGVVIAHPIRKFTANYSGCRTRRRVLIQLFHGDDVVNFTAQQCVHM